jgi:hypothetical protein
MNNNKEFVLSIYPGAYVRHNQFLGCFNISFSGRSDKEAISAWCSTAADAWRSAKNFINAELQARLSE